MHVVSQTRTFAMGAALAAAGIVLSACTYVERQPAPTAVVTPPPQPTIIAPAAPPPTVVTPAAPPPTVTVRPSY